MHDQSFGIVFGGIVVGMLCGFGPLIVGWNKRRQILAIAGFLICVAGGFVMGAVLAFPLALVLSAGLSNLRSGRRRHS